MGRLPHVAVCQSRGSELTEGKEESSQSFGTAFQSVPARLGYSRAPALHTDGSAVGALSLRAPPGWTRAAGELTSAHRAASQPRC